MLRPYMLGLQARWGHLQTKEGERVRLEQLLGQYDTVFRLLPSCLLVGTKSKDFEVQVSQDVVLPYWPSYWYGLCLPRGREGISTRGASSCLIKMVF